MKKGWEIKKLGEVLSIERGGSPRPIDKYITSSLDGINWIKISDASASEKYIYETKEKISKDGLHKTRIVNEGDFILSNSMSFGRPYIMKTTGCIHDGWLVLKQNGKKIFDTEFLYYLLSSPFVFQQFNSKAAGSTVRNLNISLVSSVDVPIPTLSEQQQIVSILNEVFERINRAKEIAEKNLQNTKELFQSYLQSIFENRDNGWAVKTIGEICTLFDSLHKTPKYNKAGLFPMVRVTEIKFGNLDITGALRVDEEVYKEFSKKHIPRIGDIVFSRVGASFGVSSIVASDEAFCLGQNTVFIIPKLNPYYCYYFLNSMVARNQMNKLVGGAAQPTISLKSIKELVIPIPNNSQVEKIVKEIKDVYAKTKKLELLYQKKINELDFLRKSVLQKAFSGEL